MVSFIIGITKGASVNTFKADMTPSGGLGHKTCLNVPKIIFLLDLGIIEECDKLLSCIKGLHVSVSLVSFYSLLKMISRKQLQKFLKYGSRFMHGLCLLVDIGFAQFLLSNKEGLQTLLF